ncbi:AraC family transcriptional regulator [Parahaliea mediterranea]|uniref:AraC family transcriptional regulator n=1 Tax=Parahaliea mediterranea TaxID=651086 RepID=UPI001F4E8647|nr:AraC family transcriptional regulator [Parahaliea mediterranea]
MPTADNPLSFVSGSGQLEPTLSPRFVTYVRDHLMDRGIDPSRLFTECGLDAEHCDEFDQPLPVRTVCELLNKAAQYSDNPSIGLDMARNYHYEASSLLILAVVSAPNVAEGIRCLCRYDRFVDTSIETRFDFDSRRAEFSHRLLAPSEVDTRQLNEYLSSFLVQALNNATRQPMPIADVQFKHVDAQNREVLERFFKAPVKFGSSENCLRFDSAYLHERFYTSHALLHEVLTQALRTYFGSKHSGQGIVDILCRELIRAGTDEAVTLERIAERLTMSPRTLRRRLADEGYSFQEVKKMAREKRAKYYLSQTSMPLSEIAFELGYSELSAFSRAFRSWVGQTPQSYREHAATLLRSS